MCGIAGICSKERANRGDILSGMTSALEHRGPDEWGYVSLNPGEARLDRAANLPDDRDARVWLGHRRLRIIDITGSRQPLCNEDGTVWVVFNGEIYNYPEIRSDLLKRGHRLREAGDTEVLVHLWEEYAEDMLVHLTGMFAFCIYDTRRDILFIARDRFGQKPLYYYQGADYLAFASELQGFLSIEDFPADDLDATAACQYFRYGYVPGPRTIYRCVRALSPGHFLLCSGERLTVRQYWRPAVGGGTDIRAPEVLAELLDEAVRIRLRSDVPLGVFLSGGIDSSLIAESMARQLERPVESFTIATDDPDSDEAETARITAAFLGTRHHEFHVTPNLADVSVKLAVHFGQPFADYSLIPTYYVSRETRKHVTVALSGDGGDELFAGYSRYANYRLSRVAGMFPRWTRETVARWMPKRFATTRLTPGTVGDFLLSAGDVATKGENHTYLFHRFWRDRCFQPEICASALEAREEDVAAFSRYYKEAGSDDPIEKWLEADQRMYLADDILVKVDIASMSVSLECRAPFLDHRLAEAVNRFPLTTKLKGRRTKALLRDQVKRRFPTNLEKLPKRGFTLPLATWLKTDLRDWAHEILFSNSSCWASFLRPEAVRRMWKEHQSPRNTHDHSFRLWIIICWCLWAEAVSSRGKKVNSGNV